MFSLTDENAPPMVSAYLVQDGVGRELGWPEAKMLAANPRRIPEGGWIWLRLDRASAQAEKWLEAESGLSEDVYDALTNDDTRPRAAELDEGLLLILRGVAHKDEERHRRRRPVSIRLFADEKRIITMRLRRFGATYALDEQIRAGKRFPTSGDFVTDLIETTLDMIEEQLDEIGARFDKLEEFALSEPSGRLRDHRRDLNSLKSSTIVWRRYLRPQQDALARLAAIAPNWIPASEVPGLRERADQTGRMLEDFDELRERGILIRDEMAARLNDRMNRTMVTLTTLSTIFLPMSVMTGLFGVNLAGIPFADRSWAFAALLLALIAVASLTGMVVRWLNKP